MHRIWRGVYAVGRRGLSDDGRLMGAALACGPNAVVSHHSAAHRWHIVRRRPGEIHLSVPEPVRRRRSGVVVHRFMDIRPEDVTSLAGIPITAPVRTVFDMAGDLSTGELEGAINEADKLGLASPDDLREKLSSAGPRKGIAGLRVVLDRLDFRLTDSKLERLFLRLVRRAGLRLPETGRWLSGFKVDFYWPGLGLIVETDGLQYHRNQVQQARDRRRDQTHAAAGLTVLRFTHSQVAFETDYVIATLLAVFNRLER